MVRRRLKKKFASSRKTPKEDEAAESAIVVAQTSDSLPVNVEEGTTDAQFEDKVEIAVDEVRNEESEENSGEDESEKAIGDAVNAIVTEINGDNEAEPEQITSEDDELDDQENVMWEDDEECYEEDDAFDVDAVSEDGATEEENDDEYEAGEEEATEEEDEVSEEEEIEEVANKENAEENEIANGDGKEAEGKKDGKEAKEQNTEKAEVRIRNIKKSSERSRKNKLLAERSEKVAEKSEEVAGRSEKVDAKDKPESSRKRKAKKRVKSMGMIFMCSSKTKNDCYQYRVLGLPESKKDIVENIYTGMRLFLYDVDLKLMYGIYKASGPGGFNIEPKAFKSQFPSQVRFTVLDDCLPLPEEKFKKVMKENYYTKTKFDCQLNSEQVKKLCKMFVTSSKGNRTKKLVSTLKAVKPPPKRRERIKRPRTGDGPRNGPRIGLREEPHYNERPRKHPRKAISPIRNPLPREDAYRQDLYLERHSSLRDRHDPLLDRRNPYKDVNDPPPRDHYRDRRDPYLERRHYSYREGEDPYYRDGRDAYAAVARDPYRDGEPRDPYRDGRDPYIAEPRVPYRDGRDPYVVEPRDPYRDARDAIYPKRHDSYRDERDPYLERRERDLFLERRDLYSSEPYSSYRRDPLPVVEYRDSYRREELYTPLSLESRHRHDIRDSYGLKRERHEPIYSTEYPASTSRAREYHL